MFVVNKKENLENFVFVVYISFWDKYVMFLVLNKNLNNQCLYCYICESVLNNNIFY